MKNSIWIKIVLIVVVISSLYIFFSQSKNGMITDKVSDRTFQQEVLESPIPAIVIICNNELWNRKSVSWSSKEPSAAILAIREIMKEDEYNDKVKFYRYIIPDGSYNQATKSFDNDSICKELNVKWCPTVIIFKDGNIIRKFEGGGCTVKKSKEKMEQELRMIIQ